MLQFQQQKLVLFAIIQKVMLIVSESCLFVDVDWLSVNLLNFLLNDQQAFLISVVRNPARFLFALIVFLNFVPAFLNHLIVSCFRLNFVLDSELS